MQLVYADWPDAAARQSKHCERTIPSSGAHMHGASSRHASGLDAKERKAKMRSLLASLVLMMCTTTALAQQPVPKVGQCPSGYRESGGYCAPMSDKAPAAIIKQGQCPSGWMQSGSYCIQTRRQH
jgi:hypothetical protein